MEKMGKKKKGRCREVKKEENEENEEKIKEENEKRRKKYWSAGFIAI